MSPVPAPPEDIASLSQRVRSLEATNRAVAYLGTFFGISFGSLLGYLWSQCANLKKEIDASYEKLGQVEASTGSLKSQIQDYKEDIAAHVEKARSTLDTHARAQAPLVLQEYLREGMFIAGSTPSFQGALKTDIKSSDYLMFIAGFSSLDGRINAEDSGPPLRVYPVEVGGYWQIEAEIASKGPRGKRDNEWWIVDYVAVRRDLVRGKYSPAKRK